MLLIHRDEPIWPLQYYEEMYLRRVEAQLRPYQYFQRSKRREHLEPFLRRLQKLNVHSYE